MSFKPDITEIKNLIIEPYDEIQGHSTIKTKIEDESYFVNVDKGLISISQDESTIYDNNLLINALETIVEKYSRNTKNL